MVKKPFSLQPIRELAQRQSDDAAATLGRLRGAEHKTRQTLEALREYRDEYQARFEQALMNGISPGELNNYRAFLAKLDRAVEEQQSLVEQSEARSENGLQQWQAQSRKVKSFDVLAEREDEKHRKEESRQEQRILDEYSSSRNGKQHD
jgi:flagellar FliJ protein